MATAASDTREVRGTPPRSGRARPGGPLWSWVLSWGFAAATASALFLGFATSPPDAALWEVGLWAAVMLLLLRIPPLRSRSGKQLDVSFPFNLAAAFVFGPAVGAALAGVVVLDVRWKRQPVGFRRALSDAWITAWSVASAGIVFELLGGSIGSEAGVLLAVGAALAADMVVNYLAVMLVDFLWFGTPVGLAFEGMRFGPLRTFLLGYWGLGFLSLPIAALYVFVGPWTLGIGVVPVLISRMALSREGELEKAREALSERDEIIEAVTANVADERSDERMRIAASIHDDVLQSLHYLTLHAQVIREDLRHGKLLQLEEDIPLLLDISRKTADQARALVGDLRTSTVGRAGAAEALIGVARELADEFDGEIVTDIRETSGNSARQTLIYQVGREALINAVRHSDASAIRVRLTDEADGTLLVVEDSGKGFSLEGGAKQGHFGLPLMRERVRAIGGSIDVASEIGRGTRVVALFPPPQSA